MAENDRGTWSGEQDERLSHAYEVLDTAWRLGQRPRPVSGTALAREAGVDKGLALAWLRHRRGTEATAIDPDLIDVAMPLLEQIQARATEAIEEGLRARAEAAEAAQRRAEEAQRAAEEKARTALREATEMRAAAEGQAAEIERRADRLNDREAALDEREAALDGREETLRTMQSELIAAMAAGRGPVETPNED